MTLIRIGASMILLLVSCSTENTLDRAGLEAELAGRLLPEHPGLVSSVTCPEVADPAPGDALTCSARLGAQDVDVHVVLEGTPDELVSSAAITDRLVAASEVAALLAATFGDEIGIPTAVDCGQPVLALPEGEPLRCEATDPTGVVRTFDVGIGPTGELELRLR